MKFQKHVVAHSFYFGIGCRTPLSWHLQALPGQSNHVFAKRTPFGTGFHLEVLPFISTSFLMTKAKQNTINGKVREIAKLSFGQSRRYRSKVCRQRLMEGTFGVISKDFFKNSGPCNHWQPSNPGNLYMLHLDCLKCFIWGIFFAG